MPDASDRTSLPIRVHEFMLVCAGRLDDDALTDARELLAVAELDRAVELLVVSLVAGRIPVTADERDRIRDLLTAVRSSPNLVDRIVVDDARALPQHRFTVGINGDPVAEDGVAEAISRVIDVLPDIRTVSCVWRTTPSGATSGSVPQRVVVVETGPDGFAPSTAYRMEQALRRAGIRAAVEVVQAGGDLPGYHRNALASARRIPVRTEPTAQPSSAAPAQSAGAEAGEPAEPEGQSPDGQPAPRPVTTTRRRTAAHAEKRPAGETASGRWQQRIAGAEAAKMEHVTDAIPRTAPTTAEPQAQDNEVPSQSPVAPVGMASVGGMTPVVPPSDLSSPVPPPAHRAEPTTSPSPPGPQPALAAEPSAAKAVPPPVTGQGKAPEKGGKDAELSQREQELLRQLHEELAKREQATPERASGAWKVDRSSAARPGMYAAGGAWQSTQDQTAINGLPPFGGTQPPDRSGH